MICWCYIIYSMRRKSHQRFSIHQLIATGMTLLVTTLLSYGFARAISDSRSYRAAGELAVVNPTMVSKITRDSAPVQDFSLKDRYGKVVRLSDFSSVDLLVINIWTTSCPACEAELPSLEEMDRRLHTIGKVALITITTNESFDEAAHLFPRGTDLRILFDPEEKVTQGVFGTSRFPETFVLDRKRRIRARFDGQRAWHSDEMLRYIAAFNTRQ